MMGYCFSHLEKAFGPCLPVQRTDEQGGTGVAFLATVAEILGMQCGPLYSFIFPICLVSPVQFQLESGYQVLPPRRRWDLCGAKLHQFGRKHHNFKFVGMERWRCGAQEFLLGLWHLRWP